MFLFTIVLNLELIIFIEWTKPVPYKRLMNKVSRKLPAIDGYNVTEMITEH